MMVDKQKVIKGLECCAYKKNCNGCPYFKGNATCMDDKDKDALELLKEQEPKIGHWILDPDGMDWNIPAWTCSECGGRHNGLPIMDGLNEANIYQFAGSQFCPNCGAKMSKEVKWICL